MSNRTRLQPLLVFALPLAAAIAAIGLLDPFHFEARTAAVGQTSAWPVDETAIGAPDAELLFSRSTEPAPLDADALMRRLDGETLKVERGEEPAAEQPAPIPEPASGLLLASGLAGLAARRKHLERARS